VAAKASGGVPHDDTQLQVDALYHLAVELSGLRGVDNVLDVALRQCLTLTGSQFGFIGLVNQEATALEIAAIQGFHPTEEFFAGHRVIPLRPSIFAIAVLENRPARSLDARFDPRRIGQPSGHPEVRTFLGVPLRLNDEPIGMIGVANRAGPYQDGHERLLLTYAAQIAIVIRNAQLYERLANTNAELERKVVERTSQLHEASHELSRKAADLKKALEETVQAQENERQRIARDVHDGLNQLLIGALLELTSGQKRIELGQLEAARESLESSQSILRSVETEIRRVVHDLHPPMLEGLGLPAAIRRLCEQFESYSGIGCRTFVDGETARMPGHAEITVYRIAQEALHNVLVHARAEKVEVDLLFEPDGLRLEVRDNGVGFDPEFVRSAPNGHIGLVSMRQRAESLGGELQLESSQGSGTTVRALVPLPLTR
jgi:signal transduction histidine kinase